MDEGEASQREKERRLSLPLRLPQRLNHSTCDDFPSPTSIITTTFFCIAAPIATDRPLQHDDLASPDFYTRYSPCIPQALTLHLDVDLDVNDNLSPTASTPDSLCSSIASPRTVLRRSLTHPAENAMTALSYPLALSSPDVLPPSPPDLSNTSSKSSKSSSFRTHSSYASSTSIHGEVDVAHDFEEIGLDDHIPSSFPSELFESQKSPIPFTATYDLRSFPKRQITRNLSSTTTIMQRELTSTKIRPAFPSLRGQVRNATEGEGRSQVQTQGLGLGLMPVPAASRRGFTSPSTPTLAMMSGKRNRSPSPASSISTHSLPGSLPNSRFSAAQLRSGPWHTKRERKSQADLERECDEDDGDDVPDDFVLENVPISPRPPEERPQVGHILSGSGSAPQSPATSPKEKKEKVKPAGNGTPLVPVEQGSLRSPSTPLKMVPHRGISMGQFPINHDSFPMKGRAKSWTAALSDLSEEAKSLTEALEAHADSQSQNHFDIHTNYTSSKPRSRSSSRPVDNGINNAKKVRVKSSLAELPPLRRTNIMIDPLPISKEKEAVLSRTRPSWLPPKNPVEEKRHLREYQKMMAAADKRKDQEVEMRAQERDRRDETQGSLGRIWEEHVLPNWNHVVGMRRTRELWWRGVAPRSRGTVWARAVGNELELSNASYDAALSRAKDLERKLATRECTADEKRMGNWFYMIRKDVEITYPELRIFQLGGPLHDGLINVLMAYTMYRSDVGYVPGTNTISAMLLLNLPSPASTFSCLANALNRPLPLSFLTRDFGAIVRIHSLTMQTLAAKYPRLYEHLCTGGIRLDVDPGRFMDGMFETLFTAAVGLDEASRLWDVWVFEGDAILVRAVVAVFASHERVLYGCDNAADVSRILEGGVGVGVGVEEGDGKGAREMVDEWMERVREAGRSGPAGERGSGTGSQTPRSGEA